MSFRLISLIFLSSLGLVTTGCRHPTAENKPLESFDFLLDWQAEPTYLGVYYAKHLGEYQKLGLDVKIVQSWGATQAATAVASGRYKLSTASGGATVLGYNNGEHILSLAVLYPKVPSVVYGLASENVKSPKDLEGKKIGIYPGSITKNEFDAFVRANHLRTDKLDIVSLSGPDIPLLAAHKLDAVLHYTEMSPVAVETDSNIPGTPGRPKVFELRLSDYGVGGYGLNIITSREQYQSQPEKLQNIAAAAVKGYVAGCADRRAATEAYLVDFPDKRPDYVRASWDKVCSLLGPTPGAQTSEGWSATIDLYKSLGLLKEPVYLLGTYCRD